MKVKDFLAAREKIDNIPALFLIGNPISYILADSSGPVKNEEGFMDLDIEAYQYNIMEPAEYRDEFAAQLRPGNNIKETTQVFIFTKEQYRAATGRRYVCKGKGYVPDMEFKYIDKKYRRQTPAAFCHSRKHWGYLNPALISSHQCLHKNNGKQCIFFQKYGTHGHWRKNDNGKRV